MHHGGTEGTEISVAFSVSSVPPWCISPSPCGSVIDAPGDDAA